MISKILVFWFFGVLFFFFFFYWQKYASFFLCQSSLVFPEPDYLRPLSRKPCTGSSSAHAGRCCLAFLSPETLAQNSSLAALRRQHVCRGLARSCSGCHSSKFERDYVTWSVIEEHNQLKTFISEDKLINHSGFRWPLSLSRFHFLTYISCDLTPHRNFNDGHVM